MPNVSAALFVTFVEWDQRDALGRWQQIGWRPFRPPSPCTRVTPTFPPDAQYVGRETRLYASVLTLQPRKRTVNIDGAKAQNFRHYYQQKRL
jgi:hypothetical protein